MYKDGDLRNIFRSHLPEIHWTSIESAVTGAGIPDANGCYRGIEFWIEFKKADAIKVRIDKFQVSWHERRARAEGRTFLAVRRRDELFLYKGSDIRQVFLDGLNVSPLLFCDKGPANWNWRRINAILIPSNFKHGMRQSPEYNTWVGMKARCYNPEHEKYKYYGGRGITICDEWRFNFRTFLKDMGKRPSLHHSIDRIDNDGNYCKKNCRWATREQQRVNRRDLSEV
jgi:hypothetical protein